MFFMMEINKYILFFSIPFIFSLFYQIKIFDIENSKSCLAMFKLNNFSGILNFIFIFLINIL
jgi:4-hydroxybenzoate polyprenyltransferase